ncbi:MAG: MFS transporter [Hydrogenophaga sp.]|nr:MFS transporter [Hydrogenophaga sp.]
MDMTVLNLAVPALSAELQPSASQLLWIIDIYGFFVAGLLITMGTLGDRHGRRRMLMIGAAAFGAASIAAAFATSAEMLIVMRALLGVAGATLAPSTMSLIRNMFRDEQERQFAIGVWIASFSVGAAIGPLVGGGMLEFFWWGSVFLLAVPVMALLLLLGPRLLPEYRDEHAGAIDFPSVVLSLAAVLAVIYGLKHFAESGLAWMPALVLAAGVLLGAAFVRRQQRLPYPLLDLTLFRQRRFSGAIAAYGLSCLAMFGVYIFITQYLQLVAGLSPLRAGLATAPSALAFVAGSLWAPRLARQMAPASVLVSGLLTAAFGLGLIALAGDGRSGLVLVVVGAVVMSLGMAPVFTIGNEMIITAAPPERAGAASAVSETASEFNGALGIAVFGSLGVWIYRTVLADAMPAGVPADVVAEALASLGGAGAVAAALPGPLGDAVLAAARLAFVDALQTTAASGAVIVLIAAAVTAAILRGGGSAPSPSVDRSL